MARRTRAELEAENLVLYSELERMRDRLDELLDDDVDVGDSDEADDGENED